ncbi:MAG TPA: hypothetical protein VMD76_10765 [Candidatus Sulfotelmatobacter sp.]|nr:hypothetical protein [Candidatus Sulfotelmatobacter sp.]
MKFRRPALFLCLVGFAFTLTAAARDAVLPAGTLLQCTLNEPNFSPSTASVGDPVLCHLRGMVEFGQQAFPRGSYLVGHLEDAKNPGHFVGKGYLQIRFDRLGVPSGDMPLDAKVIGAGKYKVDREGKIRGKGHATRDAVEWMLPPLWPWKVIMLPARGPRPTLKGESVLTLRLMDDVEIPQIAQTFGPGWQFFGQPQNQSYRAVPGNDGSTGIQLAQAPPAHREILPLGEHTFYATYTKSQSPAGMPASPGMPVFVLNRGTILAVSGYGYQDHRISYTLVAGGAGVINADEIDWPSTIRINQQRGVRVTLHAAPARAEGPGL